MKKSEYLNLRNSNTLHLGLLYEFYINSEYSNPKLPYEVFTNLFQMWLSHFGSNLEKFFKFYDNKFGIIQITDKTGKIFYK